MSSTIDPTTRRVPPLGGFNLTVLGIEIRRMLRNRRTIIFTLVFPAALFFAIGSGTGWEEDAGHGNVAAYIMVSMALYGAALTAASAGAMVATERALGWSRQLRLTPLNPAVYIGMKALIALILGAVAISVVNVVAIFQGRAAMPAHLWVACALLTLVCTMVFAALGVFVGYLVPGRERHADPRPRAGAAVLPGQRVHPDRPGQHAVERRRLDADVRGRRGQPGSAHRRAAVVRRAQRRGLAGALRRRRRVADEQGHGAGLRPTSSRLTPVSSPTPTGVWTDRDGRPGRLGVPFAAVWLVFLADTFRAAWGLAWQRHGPAARLGGAAGHAGLRRVLRRGRSPGCGAAGSGCSAASSRPRP